MAAPAKPRPVRYPRQLVIMLNDETADAIERLAAERLEPKGAVARDLIAAGLAEVTTGVEAGR